MLRFEIKEYLWGISRSQTSGTTEAEARLLSNIIRNVRPGLDEGSRSILDIPSGYGRHHDILRREGFDVFGIDLEPEFIKKAIRLYPKFKESYVVGDMRRIPSDSESYDVVVNFSSSFGYFDDVGNIQTIREFSRVLRKDGILIIHTFNGVALSNRLQRFWFEELGNGVYKLSENSFVHNFWEMNDMILEYKEGRLQIVAKDKFRLRLYQREELEDICKSEGLCLVKCFSGNSTGDLEEIDLSMLLVFRK